MERTAGQIISEALAENSRQVALLNRMAFLILFAALFLIGWGTYREWWVSAAIGGGTTAFCVRPFQLANKIRRENMMMRLLEVPLANAETAQEAAAAIRKMFEQEWGRATESGQIDTAPRDDGNAES